MPEQEENLIDTLSKVDSLDDLKAAIPPSLTEKLGEGEEGVDRALALLVGLAPFAPEPATFGRDAFNAVVAFNYETEESLSEEDSQKMIDAALEAGFIKPADTNTERYTANPRITTLVERFFKE